MPREGLSVGRIAEMASYNRDIKVVVLLSSKLSFSEQESDKSIT